MMKRRGAAGAITSASGYSWRPRICSTLLGMMICIIIIIFYLIRDHQEKKMLHLHDQFYYYYNFKENPNFISNSTTFRDHTAAAVKEEVEFKQQPATKSTETTKTKAISCDLSNFRYDICFIDGLTLLDPTSSTLLNLNNNYSTSSNTDHDHHHYKIRPYPRKWERNIMHHIHQFTLLNNISSNINSSSTTHDYNCDVNHDERVLIFSTGGYTGNLFHEFNDGILPLFITSTLFRPENGAGLVFAISDFRNWWLMKYTQIVSHLSNKPIINLDNETSRHCFRNGAIVGLISHGNLAIDNNRNDRAFLSPKTPNHEGQNRSLSTTLNFHAFLDGAYEQNHHGRQQHSTVEVDHKMIKRPIMVLVVRRGSRRMTNQEDVIRLAEEVGFDVRPFEPTPTTNLAQVYPLINMSHTMFGVHGAGLTHFLFMRPMSVLVQVVPLGVDWAAEDCFGEPARKMGFEYMPYRIEVEESSLVDKYNKDDIVLKDPSVVVKENWENTKNIYLEPQNVNINLKRIRPFIELAYEKAKKFMQEYG